MLTTWTLLLALAGTPAGTMTDAKVEADLGRLDEAARLFSAIAGDASAPEALRCEARVRRGAALRDAGRDDEALAALREAAALCASDRESMRLLVGVVSGVEPDADAWSAVEVPIEIDVSRDAAGRWAHRMSYGVGMEAAAGSVEVPRRGDEFTGEPISLSMKDAELREVFRLFAMFTGLPLEVEESVAKRTVTLELTDVPWDQAMTLILDTNGLEVEKTPEAWRIRRIASRRAP